MLGRPSRSWRSEDKLRHGGYDINGKCRHCVTVSTVKYCACSGRISSLWQQHTRYGFLLQRQPGTPKKNHLPAHLIPMVDMSIALAKLGRVEDCVADDDSAVLTEVRPTAESGGSCQASIHSTITDDSVDMTLWPIVATALQEVQIYALTDGVFVRQPQAQSRRELRNVVCELTVSKLTARELAVSN